MTKYDIRIRREGVKKSQIEKHKDFKSLSQMVQHEKKGTASRRMWILLVAALMILTMIILGTMRVINPPQPQEKENVDELLFEEFKNE